MQLKLGAFFMKEILPYILTGVTTPRDNENEPPQLQEHDSQFCYCCKGEFGKMVACDNPFCCIEWFHFSCVGLNSTPQGDMVLS